MTSMLLLHAWYSGTTMEEIRLIACGRINEYQDDSANVVHTDLHITVCGHVTSPAKQVQLLW